MQKRNVKCPFCPFHSSKDKMISHIEKVHPDMIPEGYSAARVLFNALNHKTHGVCVVCKRPTPWDENTHKYKRLCGRPECKNKLREMYKQNMIRVKGTYNILNDPEQQKKMLANRSISGEYQFADGGIHSYTGSYELKLLEFLNNVMGFNSDDIITPGPMFEYQYKGETHTWITDMLILPYNLVLDVKDGGKNPNNRNMPDYRAKQIEKEKMISNQGDYSYLRLTDNQFEQLIAVLYELKSQFIDDTKENKKVIISINEEMKYAVELIDSLNESMVTNEAMALGAISPVVGMNNNPFFIMQPKIMTNKLASPTFYLTNDIDSDIALGRDSNGKLMKIKTSSLDDIPINIYKYKGKNKDGIKNIINSIGKSVSENFIFEAITGKELSIPDQLEWDKDFEIFDINSYIQEAKDDIYTIIGKIYMIQNNGMPYGKISESIEAKRKLDSIANTNIVILESDLGYYAMNRKTLRRTNYVSKPSDIIIQEDLYK